MSISFVGRRALVTGSGSGMGRATALQLAQLGAKVFALGNVQADLDSLKAENPSIEILCQDVTEYAKTREAVKEVTPIHLLANCAGVFSFNKLVNAPLEEFDHVFGVNVKGLLNVTQAVAKDLIERKEKGSIVNVASVASFRGFFGSSAYCASKSAVVSYTKTMAIELSSSGIRVNAVSPTLILTAMGKEIAASSKVMVPALVGRTPNGRLAEVSDVVNAITFLLSDQSGMINGHNLPVDGGFLVA